VAVPCKKIQKPLSNLIRFHYTSICVIS